MAPNTLLSRTTRGLLAALSLAGLTLAGSGCSDHDSDARSAANATNSVTTAPALPGTTILAIADKPTVADDQPLNFSRDIRPILSDRCFICHGPDANIAGKAGGFRLDAFETATVPAESGAIPIVPGDPDSSALIQRITSTSPNIQMPPPASHLKLTENEIKLLRRWISEGAKYTGHWAYDPPVKPELPTIKNAAWANTPVDYFIADELERNGLSPSDPASRATLIRRVTLDLTGLPPSPEEIDAFVTDKDPKAYEKLVDRLMASEHFGERVAMVWLDAARYADTNGFHHDNIRTSWPWRQWVINAFNQNMPYDQFVIEQLAGDLLPNPTQDQILASGFCRMHNINDEGGALDAEYRVEAVADRIETIGTVFMAQTVMCSRCHDHKYDPISQEDYYSLYAYFNSVEERGVFANNLEQARAYPARMMYRTPQMNEQHQKLSAQREQLVAQNKAEQTKVEQWQSAIVADEVAQWAKPQLQQAVSTGKATLTAQPDGSVLASGPNPDHDNFVLTYHTDATDLRLIKLDVLADASLPNGRVGRAANGNAVMTLIEVQVTSLKDPKQTRALRFDWGHADFEQQNGDFDFANALRPDALGWAVAGHEKTGNRQALLLADDFFGYEGGTEIRVTLHFESQHGKHTFGRVRIDAASLVQDKIGPYPEHYFEIQKQIEAIDSQLRMIDDQTVPVLIMKELPNPVQMHVLDRGAYDGADKDRPVSRRPPTRVGGEMPEGLPNNRLGFAQWLVRPEHPLTARVHVNRIWQMLFGTGIVGTTEDFGSQAEWPSHPALLDYLAVDFIESGWDQKALIKQIVMSATYRQQSRAKSEALELDPKNRLLSYFPRRRLPGEMIRDQALFVSGLFNDTIGGPSVKPYQPDGLWREVSIGGGGTNTKQFVRDDGDALYRRSMYTFWKRTSPPPQMATFNAPTREFCVVRRDVTNTPLQALVLWNDEQFLEAARVLAQRTLAEADNDDARLELIFRRCTGERPDERTMKVLQDTLAHFKQRYANAPSDAAELLKQGQAPLPAEYDPGELAAWMMIGSTMLSLDQTIVRD